MCSAEQKHSGIVGVQGTLIITYLIILRAADNPRTARGGNTCYRRALLR